MESDLIMLRKKYLNLLLGSLHGYFQINQKENFRKINFVVTILFFQILLTNVVNTKYIDIF